MTNAETLSSSVNLKESECIKPFPLLLEVITGGSGLPFLFDFPLVFGTLKYRNTQENFLLGTSWEYKNREEIKHLIISLPKNNQIS